MKYILLAYTDRAGWESFDYTGPEFQAMCDFYEQLGKELTESGEMVATEGLAEPSLTRTVRRSENGPVAVDGPYAEAKEVLGGYFVLECASMDVALHWAAKIPAVHHGAVEVRPIGGDPHAER